MQSAAGLAEALRLGGGRRDRSKGMQPDDVLRNFTYLKAQRSPNSKYCRYLGPHVGFGDQDDVALMQAVDNRAGVNIRMQPIPAHVPPRNPSSVLLNVT